jgi:hypothetical protein
VRAEGAVGKFNKQHIEKPKYEHERINFLIFDDIIGTNNGAFRKKWFCITEFNY